MQFNIPDLEKAVEDARKFLAEKTRFTDQRQADLEVASARVHHKVLKTSWFSGIQTRMRPNGSTYLMTVDDQRDEQNAIANAKALLEKARREASEASAILGEAEAELAEALHDKGIYDQAFEEADKAAREEMKGAMARILPTELIEKTGRSAVRKLENLNAREEKIRASKASVKADLLSAEILGFTSKVAE